MRIIEILLLAVALSMDAFAVAICKGLAMKKSVAWKCAVVGLWFGGFQALMPTLGYLLLTFFSKYIDQKYIEQFDHWIAFALLGIIGANMIREAFSDDEESTDSGIGFKTMLIMAVATSIDALAIGVSFAVMNVEVRYVRLAIFLIGITTFVLSFIGVKIGNLFGSKFEKKAEFVGGVILILLGLKILLEGLGVLQF